MADKPRPESIRSTSGAPARALPEAPQADSDEEDQYVEVEDTIKGRGSALHKTVRSLPNSAKETGSSELTPLRAHYLKKTLVGLVVERELNALCDPSLGASALGLLGPPFQPLSTDGKLMKISRTEGHQGDLPILRYLFHQFLLPFPFLAAAPPTFWSSKVQPFVTSFLAINQTRLSPTAFSKNADGEPDLSLASEEELIEYHARRKLWEKLQKQLGMLFGAGVKLTTGEEVVRINQNDLRKLEIAGEEARKKNLERQAKMGPGFDVNVICVRNVVEKGRVRNKGHDEFIIRTRRPNAPDVHVSRRYGDFKRLADELRRQFPDGVFPVLPPKDRTAMSTPTPVSSQSYYSAYNPLRAFYGSGPQAGPSSGSGTPTSTTSTEDLSRTDSIDAFSSSPLSREKNRLTLRAYLNVILSIPYALNSMVLRSFLLSGATQLSASEQIDAQRRAEADAVREEGKRRFKEEAEKRVEALREGLAEFKGDILGKEGGLKGVFDVVRRVELAKDLPPAEKSVLEWGKISLAATIFQIFVAADNASDTLNQLKRIHGMMPYFMLKGILKVSNPMAMIRGILDLFLARPFGGQSLLQRMFSSSLQDEVRAVQEDIDLVAERIDNASVCQKIERYVNAPFEIQTMYRRDAAEEGLDLLAVVLRSPEPPFLERNQMQRVLRANKAYLAYKARRDALDDSDDDEGPDNEDAWLFEDLNVLMKLMVRKREKEQLLALIFEGTTAELLKDIITIFYSPLATVYKAASIADSLSDGQNFLNDLIRTVESVEELSQEDPGRTVQTFIDLVQRHEQAFYGFVHKVHSKGQGLFDSLMSWIELFLNFARDGVGEKLDMEFLLPHAGEERMNILREIDAVASYHYKLKVAYEEKVRRRFQGQGASAEETALIDSVVASLNISDAVVRDVAENEEEAESSDEEESDLIDEDRAKALTSGEELEQWDEQDAKSHRKRLSVMSHTSEHDDHDTPRQSTDESRMKKFKNSIDFHRHRDPSNTAGPAQQPPTPEPATPASKASRSRRRQQQQKKGAEAIVPPQLKYLPALAPVMVEIIRPQLRIKSIAQPPTIGRV